MRSPSRAAVACALLALLAAALCAHTSSGGVPPYAALCRSLESVHQGLPMALHDTVAWLADVAACYHTVGDAVRADQTYAQAQDLLVDVHNSSRVSREFATSRLARLLYNRAVIAAERGDAAKHVALLQQSLVHDPFFERSHLALAQYFFSTGRASSALYHYQACVAAGTENPVVYIKMGHQFMSLGQLTQAQLSLERALELDSHLIRPHLDLGEIFVRLQEYSEASMAFRRALQIDSADAEALAGLFGVKVKLASWTGMSMLQARLRQAAEDHMSVNRSQPCPIWPLLGTQASFNGSLLNRIAMRDSKYTMGRVRSLYGYTKPYYNLRVAFASKMITVAYIVHPRSSFWVDNIDLLLACHRSSATLRASLFVVDESTPERWSGVPDVTFLSSAMPNVAARTIADAAPRVLAALGMVNLGPEIESIVAFLPAPIQVALLSEPTSLGAVFSDVDSPVSFVLTDTSVTPNAMETPERLLVLPCAFVPRFPVLRSNLFLGRSVAIDAVIEALPVRPFIFGALGPLDYVDSSAFYSWIVILSSTPNSVLLLSVPETNEAARESMLVHAEGIVPDISQRIGFIPQLDRTGWLRALAQVDLFLDTWVRHSFEAVADALRLAVPVLTLKGEWFHTRYSSSLLEFLELPELVAHSPDEYVRRAVEVATSPVLRTRMRALTQVKHEGEVGWLEPCPYSRLLESAYVRILNDAIIQST